MGAPDDQIDQFCPVGAGQEDHQKLSSGDKPNCCLKQEGVHHLFRALGHPARLLILDFLSKRAHASCGDIVEALPLAQSTVSQHLQVLKEAGIIDCSVSGRCCHYTLDEGVLAKARHQTESFWQRLENDGQTDEADPSAQTVITT